jgi:hypothetical protein
MVRLLAQRSEGEDVNTHAHSTLSAEATEVKVFYPFHPLHGSTLQIQRRPKRGDGAASVADRAGKRLKIPMWMLSPSSAEIGIRERAVLSKEALLSLSCIFEIQAQRGHDNLQPIAVEVCEGGHRGATRTDGPDEPRSRRSKLVPSRMSASHITMFDITQAVPVERIFKAKRFCHSPACRHLARQSRRGRLEMNRLRFTTQDEKGRSSMSTNGMMKSLTGRVRRNTSSSDSQEDPVILAARFSRCYRLLHFIGRRVLGGPEGVEDAIDNCWFTVSRNPPRFEAEGAFRSWLLRVLIDEALAILRKNRAANVDAIES